MNNKETNKQAFSFAVISGKGGVGKSMSSVNTAVTLSKMGYKTAIIDADPGLSNCATMLNEQVSYSVANWIEGTCCLEELPQNCSGITLVTGQHEPGHSIGSEVFVDAMDQVYAFLSATHDFIVIDAPAGIGEMTLWSLDAADHSILILVDEPSAISDVYRLCKFVYKIDPEYCFGTIVNFAESEESAESTFKRFNTVLNYFLKRQVESIGFIPASTDIKKAIQDQRTLQHLGSGHPVNQELEYIAQNLVAWSGKVNQGILQSAL